MKKILTLFIALILVAGIVSVAKATDVDSSSNDTQATAGAKDRHIVKSSNGTIVVLYGKSNALVAKKSTDDGDTWRKLDGTAGYTTIEAADGYGGHQFSICLDSSDHIYVTHVYNEDIYFNKLTYSGGSWSVGARSVVDDDNFDSGNPSIIRESGGKVWIAYGVEEDQDWGRLRAAYATTPYTSWSYTDIVSAQYDVFAGDLQPALVIRGIYPFVVFNDISTGENDMKSSAWGGSSWSSPIQAAANDPPYSGFSVTTTGSTVHLVYDEAGGYTYHRYYDGSWNAGGTLSTNTNGWQTGDWGVSLTTDGTDLWCFISIYAGASNQYNIKYKKRSGGDWDGSWTAITTNNAYNRSSKTPLTTTSYIPLVWMVGTTPYPVKFDASVVTTPPGPPTNVDDGVSGWSTDDTPTFTWTSPGGEIDGYWWAVDDTTPETGGTWTTLTTATTASLSDGTHTFYVKAQNGAGIGPYGSHVCQIDDTAPGAPTSVDDGVSGWSTDDTPTFTWNSPGDTSGITGYWWAVDDTTPETGGTWTTLTTATTASLSDGTHTFYVKAENGSGLIGPYGSHVCQIDDTPPGAPTNVDDGVSGWSTDDTPTFTWTSPGDTSGIDGYWWAVDDDTPETGGTWTTLTTATTASLSDGTHTFYVKAENGSGLIGPYGSHVCQIDDTPPGTPQNVDDGVSGSSNDNTPTFTWDSVTDTSGVPGYWWAVDDNTPESGGTWTTLTTATTAPLNDGTHTFYVKAQNGSGLVSVSPGSHDCEIDTTAPAAITDLSGQYSTGDVILSWSTPGDDDWSNTLPTGSGYRIDYSSVTKSWDKDDFEVWIPTNGVAPHTEVSYTVPSLQDGTTWYFQIWTRDEVPNWSGLSNGATVWIPTPSQTYTWTGNGAEGDWDDTNNWSGPAGYPNAATDKAVINTGSESINTGEVLTIGELELGSSYSGTLTLGGALTLDDSGPWDANLTISAGTTLNLAGYTLTLETGSTFSNSGTLKLQGDETVSNKAPTNTSGSTVEYTATSSTRAIKDWTYYHLKINGSGGIFTVGAGETLGGNLTIAAGTFDTSEKAIEVAGNVDIDGIFTANGSTITVGGNWDSSGGTLNPGTSIVTFDSNDTGKTITSDSQSFASVVFDSGDGTGGWTLQDSFTSSSLQIVDGVLTDNTQTVTVNGNIIIDDIGSRTLVSAGTWIQGDDGNISNPYNWTNAFKVLQIDDGVISTRTGTTRTRKLVLGTSATLGGLSAVVLTFPDDNDFIDMGSGSSITGGSVSIIPFWDGMTKTQKAISTSVSVYIYWQNNADIQMTGNWTTGNLTIFGSAASDTEAEAALLDTNGYDLTVNGNLRLGNSTVSPNNFFGKIIFSTGTHSISEDVYVHGAYTHGYFDLGSADISIGDDVNFSSATVTPGTSTVTLNGSGAQTVTSDSESFYHLKVENTGTSVQLQDAADINGGLNVTTGTLDLNNYDITISSDVSISGSGSLTCSSGEQITVGGNWSASSGATFTAANSTTTFNGTGSFNILSSGTTFYNLAFNNSVSTWTLTDALYSAGDFTITNSSGNVNSNDKNLTIAGDFTVNGGKFTAGVSTITVAGNWDTSVSANAFIYGTSTVDLTGTGTVNVYGTGWSSSFEFRNLKCAAADETTTLLHHVGVYGVLTLGSGTLSGAGYTMAVRAIGEPFVHGGAAITLDGFIYWSLPGTITVTGGDYGSVGSLQLYPSGPSRTYDFGGDITVNGDSTLQLVAANSSTGNFVNTEGYDLTVNRILFGASWGTGDFTVNCGTSTIDIGTNGLDMANDGGSHILNLSSATVTCAGDWQLVDGSGSIDQNWGTSTVAFDNATSTSTLTGSTTFYVLISTTTGKNVKFTSDIVIGVTNHLNFENITLQSTSPGATWYLNLSGSGTQDVSSVNVQDSNASGGDTIVAFGTNTDSGNNTNWDFAPPAAITDLTGLCDSQTGDVTLSWSTPGDDGWNYTLVDESKYRIDHSSYSIQWSTSTFDVDIPTHSVTPHTQVSHTIAGLQGETTWYFRIWTQDEVFRWSGLSNGATVWVGVVVGTNTYTWTGGGAEGDWDDADNWSGAAGYPNGANDKAVINLTSSENINTGAVLTIGELELSGSYSGTLTLGGVLTLDDSEGWDGNLTIGAGTLDVSGSNHQINIDGNWSKTGGIFTSQSGTVDFTKSSSTQTLNSGGTGTNNDFYTISHSGAGALQLSTNNLEIDRHFTNSAGTFDASISTVNFTYAYFTITAGANSFHDVIFDSSYGNATISGTLYVGGNLRSDRGDNTISGNIQLNGSGDQTITGTGSYGTYGSLCGTNLTINKSGGSAILGAYMKFESLTINEGNTFDVSEDNYTLRIELGNFTNNNGTFNARSGTVVFADNTGTLTPGSSTFNNVTFTRSDGKITIVGTLYVRGNLTSARAGTTSSNTISGNIQLNGSGDQTITATHANRTGFGEVTMTMDKSGGSAVLGSTVRIYNLTINADNTFNVAGYNLTVPSTFTNNGTLQLQGDESVSNPTNNPDSTVEYTATSDSRAIKDWDYQSLKINGADGTFTLGTGETLDENLTVSTGTFDLNGSTLTINGAATIEAGAISQGSAGLTVLDGQATGTAVTVGADGTWSNTSTGNITLGAAVSNAGTITLDGDGADPIIIASSDGATQRNWQGSGSFNITDVNVSSQTCTGGTPEKIYAVSSTDGGNNTNWVFLTSVRYWVGGAGNWSDDTNHWATSSGGSPAGGNKPGAGDTAIFDVNSGTETCTINEAVDIKGLLLKNTYSGTITQGANTITIGNDNAVFSGGTFTGGSVDITINGNITISGTAFTSTSGTLYSKKTYTFSSGTFLHNDGTVDFQRTTDGPYYVITGETTFYNLTFSGNKYGWDISDNLVVENDLIITATFSYTSPIIRATGAGTYTITVLGNVSHSGVAHMERDLTIIMDGAGAQTIGNSSTGYFGSLKISNTSATVSLSNNLKLTGSLTIDASTILDVTANDYNITIGRAWTRNGTFTQHQGTVDFKRTQNFGGDGYHVITGTTTFYNLTFSGNRYGWDISDDLVVENDLIITGTFSYASPVIRATGAGAYTITVLGNVSHSGVVHMEDDLTIVMDGTSTQTIGTSSSGDIGSLQISNTSGNDVDLSSALNLYTGSTCTIDASTALDLSGNALSVPSTFTNNGTLKLQGDESVSTPTNNSGSTVEYTAISGSRAIKNWTYQSLKINGADGTFTLGTGETLGENLIVSTGTFDLNGLALSINGATTIEAGAMKTSTNTVTFGNGTGDDSVSITGGELHIESDDTSSDIVLNLGSGSWSNTGGTIIYDGSTVDTDLLSSLSAYNNLTIDSAGSTYTLDGDITVNGDLTINDGTLDTDANNYAISVGGDWNRAGGTFTVNNSTVTFITASSTSTLTGSTTFYGLVSTASGKNVKVSSDTVIGVTGYLNFENITLRSTLNGATWYLNLSGSGTQDVSGVDVRDSNASDGDTIVDFDCPDIESCYYDNNTNWDFGPPAAITDLTGQCDSDTGDVTLYWSTPGDDEWTGVLSSTSEYRIDYSTDSSRQWDKDTYEVSIPTYGVTPHTEVSRTITGLQEDTTWYFQIWTADEIPNWSGLSNGATVWVTVIGTHTYTWTDGAEDGDWTNSNNWTGATGYPNDAEDKAVINTSTRTINTPASALTIGELELGGSYSGTLTLGNNLTLDDSGGWNGNLTIGAGTTLDVSGSNHQINIDGNWSNSGTFTAQSGTVSFYATASKTLSGTMTGTSAFYNLYFDSASGTWTLNNNLKVTNVLNINAGELNASNKTIELAGSGTPFLVSGTFTPSASTVQYTSPNDTNITAANYYHLDLIDPPLETSNQKPVTSDQKELLQNLEKLKIKEIEPGKFTLKSLSGDLIEIGEERHSPPQPYLKLNRWDGEVSLKVDIPYAIDGQKSLVNNRLRWVNHRYDVDFYPKSPQEIIETIQGKDYIFRINEEGGVEFDVTLKEKPESNVFTFPIEAQGLKFYYQPPLHPEHPTWADRDGDGKPDSFRPENVVGSYAVYHETQDKFFKTKEEAEKYKCGKAFHIYRPKVHDDEGKETWGKLNINEQAGILTVTIDQDWLDNAVYPVVIDPNFGYTGEGTSYANLAVWWSPYTYSYRRGIADDPEENGTIDNVKAYIGNGDSPADVAAFVNEENSEGSGSHGQIGTKENLNCNTNLHWEEFTFNNEELVASTNYVLNVIGDGASLASDHDYYYLAFDGLPITNYNESFVDDFSGGKEDPWTQEPAGGDNKYSIYCTYTPEAGATYTLLSGTFDIDGNLTIGNSSDTMEVTADTNDPTIDLEGNFNITANSTFTASDTASFNVGGNWSNSGTFTHSTGTITLDGSSGTQTVTSDGQSFYNLVINNTGTSVQLEDDLDVNGNLTISAGTLDTKSGENNPIYVAGNWTHEGGTFECRQSTVTFDNATSTSTLTGSTTFYVLVSTATGKNVKVSSDTVIGVTGHLNFENITLRSTSSGATWYLNLSGSATQDVSGVDVRDSNADDGYTILDFDCPDIESCYYGNNTNWDFGPPAAITDLTGECDSDTGDVTLSWSTPGDDEWTGVLSSTSEYRIDYSTDSAKQWDKDDYEVPISTSGVTPHTEVSYTITGLTGDSTYYFRIWTADEVFRWSGLSNGATIWVNPILSVSISTDTYNFGDVPLGQSTHTVSVITVTNEGNVNETYSLKISSITLYDNSPSLWKSTNTTTGHNRFIFYAIFHAVQVSTSNFDSDDYVIDENRTSTADWFSDNDGGGDKQTGINVPKGDDRKLWFRLDMPTSTTTGKEEKITVTITAGPE